MPKFRKKPVVIEAQQLLGSIDDAQALQAWANSTERPVEVKSGLHGWCLAIQTLEGEHLATPGDWIIKGVKGEFYPCKPDIFALTYEVVE